MPSLSYVQLFNNCLNTNTNIVGINFKADSTNTQNTSDASIIVNPTTFSILQPTKNGISQMGIYADTIGIGTQSPDYCIQGASKIIIGNPTATVTILGRVNFSAVDGGITFYDPIFQKARVRF